MQNTQQPLIPGQQQLPEITFKVILLAIILAVLLAASNTYLALKIGILTSASIPAAIISMAVLRFFKNANILENNLVQTAASAGEAVAGGIVYTVPALIIIHYWSHFDYWTNVAIALAGGILGVFFSIPLRRVLMNAPHLHFPEGRAIAEVLRIGDKRTVGIREMLWGSSVGALLELAQTGFKVMANSVQGWFAVGNTIFGFGGGFSAALIGAGYVIGFNVGFSILLGALIGWGMGVPMLSHLTQALITPNAASVVSHVYSEKIRYMGIGGMLIAGLWTLLMLLKPFYESLRLSLAVFHQKSSGLSFYAIPRTERDMPIPYVLFGILIILIALYFLFRNLFHIDILGFSSAFHVPFILGSLLYIAVIGFIFSAICGYFSGLVGVAASPGSSIVIASMLLAALILRTFMGLHVTSVQLLNGAAITIMVGAVITGAACIANDNIQDLKVGHILGATPWKQQIMLLLGVMVAAAIIPPIMQLLFHVYGIADVFPRAGMDPNQVLAAPPAAMMAAISQGVFNHDLPWNLLAAGAVIILFFIAITKFLQRYTINLSILGIAIGMYLPLTSSVPLFLGGLMALIARRSLKTQQNSQRGILLACGLLAGAALMDVILAIPMALSGNSDVLRLLPTHYSEISLILSAISIIMLGVWFKRVTSEGQ